MIFIGIVIFSSLVSYAIGHFYLFDGDLFGEEVINSSIGIAEIIEHSDPNQLDEISQALEKLNYSILLFDENGVPLLERSAFSVSDHMLSEVFHSREENGTALLMQEGDDATRLIGMPITVENEPYALFVHLHYEEWLFEIGKITRMLLLVVLTIGSLLILLASRYVLNPVKKLTNAAREMAKGNFSVRLKSKNRDEVGELITSFNHMASEVEKIDKMREDFVSSVSHEFQSPLTSIRGFTRAIRDEVIPKQNQKEYLDIISQETERLSRLSENLLRLASLDSEHHPYNPERFRLDEQIRRTVLATEPQWKSRNVQISLDVEPVEITADKDLLEQVWLNLLTNAIKYSFENETIFIECKKGTSAISVRFKDVGKGIPNEELPHLFERFYKVDKARSSSVEGNGLGLSIVKKILSLHGYTIDVASEEGVGSTFTVHIPLIKETEGDY